MQYRSLVANTLTCAIGIIIIKIQGTRKSWQSGQDKMLCTDRPHERLNICLVFYILNE